MISSSAYGLSADLNVLHIVDAKINPLAPSSGTAAPAYSASNKVLSANETLGLGVLHAASFGERLSTGLITSSASSPYTPTPTGTANATINHLSSDLRSQVLGATVADFLGINATTISSTSSVSGFAAPLATGSSVIEGLTFSGSVLHGLSFSASALADAAPNTVLFDAGGLEILLNEQIRTGDGVTSAGIETNAIDVIFDDFVLGTGVLSGDLVIGHSQADITGFVPPVIPPINPITPVGPTGGVPEPAVWAELLAGFGLSGAAIRRRRGQATTA